MATTERQSNRNRESYNCDDRLMNSNLESFLCIWLDQNICTTSDNIKTQREIREVINYLQTFHNMERCEEYIRLITKEKIVLLVSGEFGRKLIPRIHDLPQLAAFYVFCQDQQRNEQWANIYKKLRGVFIDRAKLIEKLVIDQKNRSKVEDGVSISVINSGFQSLEVRNAMYLWFQLFIEVLLRMHHKFNDRKEILDIVKHSNKGNFKELQIIDEFERDYIPEKAIWWYTRETCFYRMMNKALRVQDFEMLFAMRFFITDIAKQLKYEYDKYFRTKTNRDVIFVYRGQAIASDELELMKNNINQYVSMKSFLSTSYQRAVAVEFARNSAETDELHRILFEIEINPCSHTKEFADISSLSYFENESEVFITLGALFLIKKVSKNEDEGLWIAKLSLADEDVFELKETFVYMKSTIGKDTDLDSLGKILIEMGEHEQARKYYNRMLHEAQLATSSAELGLGKIDILRTNTDESLKHLKNALHIRERLLGCNNVSVAECYTWIGTLNTYVRNDYAQALLHLRKAVKIQEAAQPSDLLVLAVTYTNMADAHQSLGQFDYSLDYHTKALEIRVKLLPKNHPHIAETYNNLGALYEEMGKYVKALEYLEKSMEIKHEIFTPTHKEFIVTAENIKKLKKKMKNQINIR